MVLEDPNSIYISLFILRAGNCSKVYVGQTKCAISNLCFKFCFSATVRVVFASELATKKTKNYNLQYTFIVYMRSLQHQN